MWEDFCSGGRGCMGGYCKKMPEAALMSDKDSSSQLQHGLTAGKSWANQWRW